MILQSATLDILIFSLQIGKGSYYFLFVELSFYLLDLLGVQASLNLLSTGNGRGRVLSHSHIPVQNSSMCHSYYIHLNIDGHHHVLLHFRPQWRGGVPPLMVIVARQRRLLKEACRWRNR